MEKNISRESAEEGGARGARLFGGLAGLAGVWGGGRRGFEEVVEGLGEIVDSPFLDFGDAGLGG